MRCPSHVSYSRLSLYRLSVAHFLAQNNTTSFQTDITMDGTSPLFLFLPSIPEPCLLALSRDWLIGNITQTTIPTANLTNGTTYSGSTSFGNYTYQSDIQYLTGYLPNTNDAINHNITVGVNGFNASDGFLALINVKITATPPKRYAALFPFA